MGVFVYHSEIASLFIGDSMQGKFRLIVGSLALCLASATFSQGSDVVEVGSDFFEQNAQPNDHTIWLFKENEPAKHLSRYRARFMSTMTLDCLADIEFDAPQVLDSLNRKTRFSDLDGQLIGKRRAGIITITFDLDVSIENGLEAIPPSLSVSQHLYNYNRFVDSADFEFVLTPVSQQQVRVDLLASNRVNSDIPNWVSNLFQSNVDDKVLHFQQALNQLCLE